MTPRPHPLPFRLGATSYVIPGGLVENALALRGIMDDMQLVLFDSPHGSNIPTTEIIAQLGEVAHESLTFALHLPGHLRLTTHDPIIRAQHLEETMALLDRCAPLPLSAVVVHLEGDEPTSPDPQAWDGWRAIAHEVVAALLPVCPAPLCIENIERYPLEQALPIVETLNTHLCLDIGHLWKTGRDPHPLLATHLHQAPIMHLHGWDGRQDHQSLAVLAPEVLPPLLATIAAAQWQGVLTLEVFEGDFWSSRDWLIQAWDML